MPHRTSVESKDLPASLGPFSQAVLTRGGASRLLFLSGQCGFAPSTGQLVGLDIESQTRQALKNVGAVLSAGGLDYNSVVKCTVLLADIRDFQRFNAVYAEFFAKPYPARECYQVSNLPAGACVEIVAVAETDGSAAKL